MQDTIYFSLYAGVPDCPVRIYKQARWILDNQTALDLSIIGKSHRVISRQGEECITEFIACSPEEMPGNFIDQFPVRAGENLARTYRLGSLVYRVHIQMVSRALKDMEDFLDWIRTGASLKVLSHNFQGIQQSPIPAPSRPPENPGPWTPFTGLAVDLAANRFYTVHTYPEKEFSILSQTEVRCPVFSTVP
ncbi:MAG: DUF2617 family protein [Nitrospinaceae bacterium]